MEQTEEGTCCSKAAPGALALLLKTGQLTLHSTLVTAAAVFPFQFHSIPYSNPTLTTDAEKLKYQPAWLRRDLQPLGDSITAATLLLACKIHHPKLPAGSAVRAGCEMKEGTF